MSESMIISDPKVMMGKPVVAGTRITVDLILEKLGSGESIEAVLESHPRLTREEIVAALRSPPRRRAEVVYPVSAKSREPIANEGVDHRCERLRQDGHDAVTWRVVARSYR
jgi:uncharacterized protein (DUF433 family)